MRFTPSKIYFIEIMNNSKKSLSSFPLHIHLHLLLLLLLLLPLLLLPLFLSCNSSAPKLITKNDLYSDAVLAKNRIEFKTKQINSIHNLFAMELNAETESEYEGAFWAMELMLHRDSICDLRIAEIAANINRYPDGFIRAFLELIYTLYPSEFIGGVEKYSSATIHPKLFAMCMNYLRHNEINVDVRIDNFLAKNPNLADHPIINMMKLNLTEPASTLPAIEHLLNSEFMKSDLVLFSFQRKNRDFHGQVAIRFKNKFLTNENGDYILIPQFARAISNLPGYLTNGNTPQGIFSFVGLAVSENVFIGPTPNLQLRMPFEVSPKEFFHGKVISEEWTREEYSKLISHEWREYEKIFEAFYAGKAGRTEIISHGTTIDPEFYAGKNYYPFTPSLGCLTVSEIWDESSGNLKRSDQIKLINILTSLQASEGYFVVLELNDEQIPVSREEVSALLSKTQSKEKHK